MPNPVNWGIAWPFLIGAFSVGYLLGSIPFGLVVTRLAGLGDLRQIGSGNIGATNVLRTGRKGLALLTLLLDGGKAALAAGIALYFLGRDPALMAAFGAVLGHMFPIWLKFKGGKGVASIIGVYLVFSWQLGLAVIATWLAVAAIFRYSSLAALVALAAAPAYAFYLVDSQIMQLCLVLGAFSWYRHRDNLIRLIKGEESKINLSRKSGSPPAETPTEPPSAEPPEQPPPANKSGH